MAVQQQTRNRFRGEYETLPDLQTARPSGRSGDYAVVDAGIGGTPTLYMWDASDEEWSAAGGGGGGSSTTKKVQEFIADGVAQEFTVSNGTLDQIAWVIVGGVPQPESILTINGQDVDLGSVPGNGVLVEIHYFEGLSESEVPEGTPSYRGEVDLSVLGEMPETGGSGGGGSIRMSNYFRVTRGAEINGVLISDNATIEAKESNPGQDMTKWWIKG